MIIELVDSCTQGTDLRRQHVRFIGKAFSTRAWGRGVCRRGDDDFRRVEQVGGRRDGRLARLASSRRQQRRQRGGARRRGGQAASLPASRARQRQHLQRHASQPRGVQGDWRKPGVGEVQGDALCATGVGDVHAPGLHAGQSNERGGDRLGRSESRRGAGISEGDQCGRNLLLQRSKRDRFLRLVPAGEWGLWLRAAGDATRRPAR